MAEASRILSDLGLTPAVTTEYSSTVAKGNVIAQSQAAGIKVVPGTEITIVISLGPEQVTVPTLTGKTRAAAEKALTDLGLTPAVTTAYSETVAKDNVIAQSKTAGSKADRGSTVTITVSLGREQITMPDFVGKTRSQAEALISQYKLTNVSWKSAENDADKDTIYNQSVKAGTKADPGAALTLYVSLGSASKVPDVVGMDEATASAILRGRGYAVSVVYRTSSTTGVLSNSPAAGQSLAEGKTVTITVGTTDTGATRLSLPMGDLTLGFAETVTLQVSGAQGRTLSYRSSDSKIAAVDSTGKVTANGVGRATITVTAGSESVQCTVTVTGSTSDFTTTVSGGSCVVTGYKGSASAVVVPDRINGLPVTAIGASAFAGTSITSIRLPATVTSIGASAFESCPHLSSVSLSSSLTQIGARAFAECGVLRRIDIPAGVRSIGASAFERCYALESVYLPASVTSIGDRAFRYCSALTMYVPANSAALSFAKNNGVEYEVVG